MYDQPKKKSFGTFQEIVILILLLCSGGCFGFWYHLKWQDDRAWREALEKPTIVGFEKYLDEKPGGGYVEEARSLIQRIKKIQDELKVIKDHHSKKASDKGEKKFLLDHERMRDNSAPGKAVLQKSDAKMY